LVATLRGEDDQGQGHEVDQEALRTIAMLAEPKDVHRC
jgi:hypothetical protein